MLQPEGQRQLDEHNPDWQIEDALETERLDERAADEIRRRIGHRPGDVVNANGARHAFGCFAFADERFNRRPDETHAEGHDDRGEDLARHGIELRTDGQRDEHDAEPEFERGEITVAPREPPALPGTKRVNQSEQRGEGEVVLVTETKPRLHEKVEVVEKKHRGEGTHSLDGVTGGFEAEPFVNRHGWLEISRMALRQYHLTASDIGGCSLSNSSAEHQRMS